MEASKRVRNEPSLVAAAIILFQFEYLVSEYESLFYSIAEID